MALWVQCNESHQQTFFFFTSSYELNFIKSAWPSRVLTCIIVLYARKKKKNLIRYNDKVCKSEQCTKVTVKAHIYTERKKRKEKKR